MIVLYQNESSACWVRSVRSLARHEIAYRRHTVTLYFTFRVKVVSTVHPTCSVIRARCVDLLLCAPVPVCVSKPVTRACKQTVRPVQRTTAHCHPESPATAHRHRAHVGAYLHTVHHTCHPIISTDHRGNRPRDTDSIHERSASILYLIMHLYANTQEVLSNSQSHSLSEGKWSQWAEVRYLRIW